MPTHVKAYMPNSGVYHLVPPAEFHPGVMGVSTALCGSVLHSAVALEYFPPDVYAVCPRCWEKQPQSTEWRILRLRKIEGDRASMDSFHISWIDPDEWYDEHRGEPFSAEALGVPVGTQIRASLEDEHGNTLDSFDTVAEA